MLLCCGASAIDLRAFLSNFPTQSTERSSFIQHTKKQWLTLWFSNFVVVFFFTSFYVYRFIKYMLSFMSLDAMVFFSRSKCQITFFEAAYWFIASTSLFSLGSVALLLNQLLKYTYHLQHTLCKMLQAIAKVVDVN